MSWVYAGMGDAAEKRMSEGYECKDWYFCQKSLQAASPDVIRQTGLGLCPGLPESVRGSGAPRLFPHASLHLDSAMMTAPSHQTAGCAGASLMMQRAGFTKTLSWCGP